MSESKKARQRAAVSSFAVLYEPGPLENEPRTRSEIAVDAAWERNNRPTEEDDDNARHNNRS